MENMYFQIKVKEQFRKYLGCAITSPEGEEVYFQFNVLIYGLKSAVHAVTRLTRPLVKKANLMGIRMSIYIDDGKILGRSKKECEFNLKKVLNIAEAAGWKINREKTIYTASQAIYYLGMVTCTKPLLYYLPDFKIDHIASLLEKAISGERIEKREFARLLGSVIAAHKALGPMARILLRSSHVMLATATTNFLNMKGTIKLSSQIKQELLMLRDIIRELNGQPIITSRTGMTFSKLWYENKSDERLPFIVSGEAPEPEVQGMFRGILPKEMLYDIIASDASDFQEHAFSVLRIEDAHIRKLSEKERGFSSGQRELGAMLNYLRGKANDIYSDIPKLIYWLTDSQNVCNWLERGSQKYHIQSELISLMRLLTNLNLSVVPIHVPREHSLIALADMGSKFGDTDDWSIDDKSLQILQIIAGKRITCDTFAYNTNARCQKFYSKIPSPGCSGINAYSMDWSNDFNYVCPPIKEISFVINHIEAQECEGILVVPKWPSAIFWNKITDDGAHLKPMFVNCHTFKPYISQGQETYNVLAESLQIMLGLVFDSRKSQLANKKICIGRDCRTCSI